MLCYSILYTEVKFLFFFKLNFFYFSTRIWGQIAALLGFTFCKMPNFEDVVREGCVILVRRVKDHYSSQDARGGGGALRC